MAKKLSASDMANLRDDLGPVAARINELAGKHGVARSTITRHALLLPVPLPGLTAWNDRVAGQ